MMNLKHIPGFSADAEVALTNVRPQQIYRLLEVVHGTSIGSQSFVADRYNEGATHFAETLRFLEALNWVRFAAGEIAPIGEAGSRIVTLQGEARDTALAEALLGVSTSVSKTFARYIAQFTLGNGEFHYEPVGEQRLRHQEARDFLMALGAVAYDAGTDTYILTEGFRHLGLWARNVLGPSMEQLAARQCEHQELGRAAELEVLEWEKRRVGPMWASRVQHESDRHPTACYDIASVTVEGGETTLRFIEVKAVPAGTYEFHWTRAEIDAALVLGDRYFLYLVPVHHGAFDVQAMLIVPNAYANVYQDSAGWLKWDIEIVCRKRESSDT